MKKYVCNFIKSRLPLFAVILVALLIIAFVSAINLSFVESSDLGFYIDFDLPQDAGILPLAFVMCVMCTILPLFSMGYRYSLTESDIFRQTAQKNKKFRYAEHGITLGFVLASYTIAFALFLAVAVIKNQTQTIPTSTAHFTYNRYYFNYLPYLYVYLLTLAFSIGNYFISYLFASRSNNLLNSIILVLLGQAFMGFFPSIFAQMGGTHLSYVMISPLGNASVSFGPLFLHARYTNWIIAGDKSYTDFFRSAGVEGVEVMLMTMTSFIVFFTVAIAGLVTFLFEKDPSSEWAGKPETGNVYQDLFCNLLVGATATVLFYDIVKRWDNTTSAGTMAFFLLAYVVVYYTLYSALKRDFKPRRYQIITMIANTGLMVAVGMMLFGCIGFTPVN